MEKGRARGRKDEWMMEVRCRVGELGCMQFVGKSPSSPSLYVMVKTRVVFFLRYGFH